MAALGLIKGPENRAPDKERAASVAENALEEGLVLLTAGQHENVFRTLMSLSITDDELAEGLSILTRAVGELD
jgi:4-aminobutyrate aminotransferase / (S)-3-amino-2-methylpropionate transaminase / 5-aminovalerate transaminase